MNGLQLSQHIGNLFNSPPESDGSEWDDVTIDNRVSCPGCFGSQLVPAPVTIGRDDEYDTVLECWLDMPIDDCGSCQCKIYCGSKVEFPNERPGEVFTALKRIDTTRNRCVRWKLEPVCDPCD